MYDLSVIIHRCCLPVFVMCGCGCVCIHMGLAGESLSNELLARHAVVCILTCTGWFHRLVPKFPAAAFCAGMRSSDLA